MKESIAQKRADMPIGTLSILERRTLANDFRVLSDLLKPGQIVVDYGCGSGALTVEMAARTFPGKVVGVDINEGLLEKARSNAKSLGATNVSFINEDVYQSNSFGTADIVASARMLQWLEFPDQAVASMAKVAKLGGLVVLLDYNHTKVSWTPEPPASFKKFYDGFLAWRASSGMDNEVGDHLVGLMEGAGLKDIQAIPQYEVADSGSEHFIGQLQIWRGVADSRGHQMVTDGFISEVERETASEDYSRWMQTEATKQTLYLVGVIGTR